jgi:hypothetical protein
MRDRKKGVTKRGVFFILNFSIDMVDRYVCIVLTYDEDYKEKSFGQLFCHNNNYSADREIFDGGGRGGNACSC